MSTSSGDAIGAKAEKLGRARESFAWARSDLLTDARAYEACIAVRQKGESHGAVRAFCDQVSTSYLTSNLQ